MSCPSFHEFWAKRDQLNGIYEQLDHGGFIRAERPATRAEKSAHPGVVILVRNGIETLIPGVDHAALKDIQYRTFVRAVLEANWPRTITLTKMQLIWIALVYKLFRFECACAKESKANEVILRDSLNELLSLTNTYQSMGVDGFSQTQYLQLALDVRCGNPPPRLSLVVALSLPRNERTRKRNPLNSGSETDEIETGSEEVLNPSKSPQDHDRSILM